jgi:hypothetical protein
VKINTKSKILVPILCLLVGAILAGLVIYWFYVNKTLPDGMTGSSTSPYGVPSPDATLNCTNCDYYGYAQTYVPTEERERISLASLFGNDVDKMNRYWDQSVYIKSNTEITITSIQRSRSGSEYEAMALPLHNIFTGKNYYWTVPRTALSVVVSGDTFLVLGTTPGSVLANIQNIETNDATGTITVHANIEPEALYVGFSIASKTNNPQVNASEVATPDPRLESWLIFHDQMDTEAGLINKGLLKVSREALWLILNTDGPKLFTEFKKSIENSGNSSGYDLLAPYIRDALCSKIASYQSELEVQGHNLDRLSCDNNVKVVVVLTAIEPTDDTGQITGMKYLKMAHSGAYLQIPDPNFSVTP